ncbi:unnamed protein product [Musa acuminata subsp. burmannicoides]
MSTLPAPPRPKRKKIWVDYLVQFRWIIIVFVALPLSCFIYFLSYLEERKTEKKPYKQRQKEHEENVHKVVKRLQQRNPFKDGLVCTARKPYIVVGMRHVDYKRARHFEVDLSPFNNVLDVDRERMVVKVEPLVTMGQLSRITVPMNLALPVVSELNDLTVGGLINGYGIEGSSHIYGLFSDTLVSLEVVLADGKVVRATKDNEYSDLFYAIPWSQGTLGLLVSAEIKLIPVKEYMKLTYKPVRGAWGTGAGLRRLVCTQRWRPEEDAGFRRVLDLYAHGGVFMISLRFRGRSEEEGERDQPGGVVVQTVVLSARRNGVEEGRVRGVHPDAGVLPPAHQELVLGDEAHPAVRRPVVVPVVDGVDDASQDLPDEDYAGGGDQEVLPRHACDPGHAAAHAQGRRRPGVPPPRNGGLSDLALPTPPLQAPGEDHGIPRTWIRAGSETGRHQLRADVCGHRRLLRPRARAERRGVRRRRSRAQAGGMADPEPWFPTAVLGVGAQRGQLLEDVRSRAVRPLPQEVQGDRDVHGRLLQVQEGEEDREGGAGGGGSHRRDRVRRSREGELEPSEPPPARQ